MTAYKRIAFSEWTPDIPSIANELTDVNNCVPSPLGYAPFLSCINYSGLATEALNSSFVGKYGNSVEVFAGGTAGLWKLSSADYSLSNVSKSGGYSGNTRWSFAQFGTRLLASNNSSQIQGWVLGTSTAFSNLSTDAPLATYITVVKDFVVAANIGNGLYPNMLQWSDINNEVNWTSSLTSQADSQILPDGGNINGITGGEFGIVFMERAIYRMSYIGSPFFFQFDNISRNLGCIAGGSVAQNGKVSYFLSPDGFYSCDGSNLTPIGVNKIDKFFFANADINNIQNISSVVDPLRKLVMWNYQTLTGRSIIIYNWSTGTWSKADTDSSYLAVSASGATANVSLDSLLRSTISTVALTSNVVTITTTSAHGLVAGNTVSIASVGHASINGTFTVASAPTTTSITYALTASNITKVSDTGYIYGSLDSISTSFDTQTFTVGQYILGGVRGNNIVTFTGANTSASITTGDVENGYMSTTTLARLQINNGTGSVAVASRFDLDNSLTYSALVPTDTNNMSSLRSTGRYHRFNIQPSGNWTTAMSLDVNIVPRGSR